MVAVGWTPTQKRAYLIADNKLTENGEWDQGLLLEELGQLRAEAFDIGLTGFTVEELDKALAGASGQLAGADPDKVPDKPDAPVTRRGDLWILGAHRVLCGDSTNAMDVAALLGGAVPNLMVTDPPYGVDYDPEWRHRQGLNNSDRIGKVQNDGRADWAEAWRLFPGAIAYVWHGALHAVIVAKSLEGEGFAIRAQIIWAKTRLIIGRGDYHWQHEPCWYAVRETGNWTGDRKQTTLWTISSANQDTETSHGTQKPVECMQRPIMNNSKPGDSVYEPFLGSGTTLIAAQQADRRAYAMEIDPGYVDVAVQRWQEFTGLTAILQSDGHSFAEIAAERRPQNPQNTEENAQNANV